MAGEPVPDPFNFDKPRDPEWYKRAVFYEVLIRGFADSSGDGTGDLRGLTSRLDYLQWLRIDSVWLLPIFAAPPQGGGGAQAGYPGHRRPGHEPPLRPAPVVPGLPVRPGRPVR